SFQEASNYDRAVYATLDVSFDEIKCRSTRVSNAVEAQAAKNAISILQIFAFFHQENIMAEIFERAAKAPRMERISIDIDPHGEFSPRTILLPHELLQLDKNGKWDDVFFREGICVLQSFSLVNQG